MTESKKCVSKGTLFGRIENDCWDGMAPETAVPEKVPILCWKGARLPWGDYCQLASLGRWVYEKFKAEVQWRSYYNQDTQAFLHVVREQTVIGLSTREDVGQPEPEIPPGFSQIITGHTHAAAAAFQSGIDSHDEMTQTGLHITLGNMDKRKISLHARLVFRGFQYPEVSLAEWIEGSINCSNLDPELEALILEWSLTHPETIDFPDEWKEKVHGPAAVVVGGYRGTYDYNGRGGSGELWTPNYLNSQVPPRPL